MLQRLTLLRYSTLSKLVGLFVICAYAYVYTPLNFFCVVLIYKCNKYPMIFLFGGTDSLSYGNYDWWDTLLWKVATPKI